MTGYKPLPLATYVACTGSLIACAGASALFCRGCGVVFDFGTSMTSSVPAQSRLAKRTDHCPAASRSLLQISFLALSWAGGTAEILQGRPAIDNVGRHHGLKGGTLYRSDLQVGSWRLALSCPRVYNALSRWFIDKVFVTPCRCV